MAVILPIKNKLKKKIHKDIALVQDLVVIEMYNNFPDVVIHGGTCIWRCYSGNRFSEDIDVYLPIKFKQSKKLRLFIDNLKRMGFEIKKFKETENSIFAKFSYQNTIVSFEAVFKNIKDAVAKPFEMSDGSFIVAYVLIPEEVIREKVFTYKKRKKIRDLYDIFFLLNFVENKSAVKYELKILIKDFEEPLDLTNLKTLIITGAVPTYDAILQVIKKWAK